MYDPTIARWNRVDRFSEKYYDLSPYSFGAGNPLMYTDVNGDSLVINYFDNSNTRQTLHYGYTESGGHGFYNKDGSAYAGGDKFVDQVSSALGRLGLGKEGRQMIDFLSGDAQVVSIGMGISNSYNDKTGEVGFNLNSNSGIPTEGGIGGLAKAPAYISLGHELAHAEDHLKGTLNTNRTWTGSINYPEAEKYATHRENQFRSENGLPLRTHYGVIETSPKVFTPDPLNRIIDSIGRSLIYPTVKYR